MKVCPQCGFVDVSQWRQNRWRTHVEFEFLSYFQEEKPDLARQLIEGKSVVMDEYYAYRLQPKGPIVERIWVKIYKTGGKRAFHIPSEHFNHKKDPFQSRLLEAKNE